MIKVTVLDKRYRRQALKVKRIAMATLAILNHPDLPVDIYLISNQRSVTLNWRWRGKKRPASVLSFTAVPGWPRDGDGGTISNELYLAPGYLSRKGFTLQLVVVHGLLHLLGYSHESQRRAAEMERKEAEILKKLG